MKWIDLTFESSNEETDASISIENISITGPMLSITWVHIDINGSGDLRIERWTQPPNDKHLMLETQEGFSGGFNISGPFKIKIRTGSRHWSMSPGQLTIQRDLSSDGAILIDTSGEPVTIDGTIEIYYLGFALRVRHWDVVINATGFILQWDDWFPPINVHTSGTLKIKAKRIEVEIGMYNENQQKWNWYGIPITSSGAYIYAFEQGYFGVWWYIGGTYPDDGVTIGGSNDEDYKFSPYHPPSHPSYPDTGDPDDPIEQYRWQVSTLDSGWQDAINGDIPDTDDIWGVISFSPGLKTIKLSIKDNQGVESTATLYMDIS